MLSNPEHKSTDSPFHTTQSAIDALPELYKEFVPVLVKQGKIVIDEPQKVN